jgi:HlyD family secretion protein
MTMPRPSSNNRTRVGVTIAVVAVVLVGVVGASMASASNDGGYRTATVERATVTRTLQGSGTITPVDRVAVAFPGSGTVASVSVKAGQRVTVGQTLASLDTASLQRELDSANVTLTQAQLDLSEAEAGQLPSSTGGGGSANFGGGSSTGSGSTSPTATADTSSTAPTVQTAALKLSTSVRVATVAVPSGPSGSGGSTSLAAQIKAAQRELLALQKQLDAALAEARADLAAAKATCSSPSTPTSTTSTTVASSTGTCTDAQQASLDAQAQVATLEAQVGTAISKLDALLSKAAAANTGSGHTATSSPSGTTGTGSSSSSPFSKSSGSSTPSRSTGSTSTGSSSGSTSTTPTAAQLASYQSAVDAAASKVAVAEQSLAAASIVSPTDGTVTSVTLAKGDSVSASSTTANVVVVGKGGYEVSVPVSVTDRPSVAIGQAATVVPDSNGKALKGTVVALSVAGTTSGTTTTYTAVIGLSDSRVTGLHDGAGASTSITVDTVAYALTVPTSAVHTTNSTHTVTVLEGGKTRSVTVRIGTVGADRTVITKGLTAGRKVVLADLSQPLPSSASQANTRTARFGVGAFRRNVTGGPPGGFSGFGGSARTGN